MIKIKLNNDIKITMKIDSKVHRKLQMVKGMIGVSTFSDTIQTLIEHYLESTNSDSRSRIYEEIKEYKGYI